MSNKVHRNPERGKLPPHKTYVPQYQLHGIEPTKVGGVKSNQRMPQVKQTLSVLPVKIEERPTYSGSGFVPNVGSVEHTWSGVDGAIIDDLGEEANLDPNHPMIDNNEYVSEAALTQIGANFRPPISIETDSDTIYPRQNFPTPAPTTPDVNPEDLLSILMELQEEAYLLIVGGVALCSGPKEEIQEQAEAMLYGEHERCDGTAVSPDDIVVVRKIKLSLGLHLE